MMRASFLRQSDEYGRRFRKQIVFRVDNRNWRRILYNFRA
jgi:hypothetical protein